jgi:hypothetical protein
VRRLAQTATQGGESTNAQVFFNSWVFLARSSDLEHSHGNIRARFVLLSQLLALCWLCSSEYISLNEVVSSGFTFPLLRRMKCV